jgi:hypothetical protein
LEAEKIQMQQEKEQLLVEKLKVKEPINKALHFVKGLEPQAKDQVTHQVENLIEAIQQLQQIIADLELRTVPDTPQDVRDQRDATSRGTVERIKALTMECKKLSDCSAQTYE